VAERLLERHGFADSGLLPSSMERVTNPAIAVAAAAAAAASGCCFCFSCCSSILVMHQIQT